MTLLNDEILSNINLKWYKHISAFCRRKAALIWNCPSSICKKKVKHYKSILFACLSTSSQSITGKTHEIRTSACLFPGSKSDSRFKGTPSASNIAKWKRKEEKKLFQVLWTSWSFPYQFMEASPNHFPFLRMFSLPCVWKLMPLRKTQSHCSTLSVQSNTCQWEK